MTARKKSMKQPGLMDDPVLRLFGGRSVTTEEDALLVKRANDFFNDTSSNFKKLFIERAPVNFLRQTIELASLNQLAQETISHLVSIHLFNAYLSGWTTPETIGQTLSETDCEYLEYALALTDFAVRLDDGTGGELMHEYIVTMINNTYSDLSYVERDRRIMTGKAYCLLTWVNSDEFPRVNISSLERQEDLPFILDHLDAIEERIKLVVERGSTRPDDLQVLLDAHPSLGDGAL